MIRVLLDVQQPRLPNLVDLFNFLVMQLPELVVEVRVSLISNTYESLTLLLLENAPFSLSLFLKLQLPLPLLFELACSFPFCC